MVVAADDRMLNVSRLNKTCSSALSSGSVFTLNMILYLRNASTSEFGKLVSGQS